MNAPSFFAARRGVLSGFTLVEMIITLTVFVLLSAMIFGIVTGVLSSAGSLQDNQNRGDQTMALQAFLKKQFAAQPSQSILVSYRRGDGEGLVQNGVIMGTDSFLTAIDAKAQANGLYTLRLATFSPAISGPGANSVVFTQAVTTDDSSLNWTDLIHDIKTIGWKFQDSNTLKWVDQWNGLSSKPALIEISVEIAGDLRPTLMDFWLPHVIAPPALALPSTSTTNSAPIVNGP